ncbi:MAG: Gldg family protein [Clostridia bacterium]|nr:Gldg family protein [Clostridia bacterium]
MKKIKELFGNINMKSLKYGSLSLVMVVAFIAIAVVVNLMVGAIQDKGLVNLKLDLTTDKLYSIGDTSKEILKKLDKDVEIFGLFDIGDMNSNERLKQIKEVLSQYEKFPRVKVTYLDPDKNPGLIKQIDPTGLKDIDKGDFVVKSGNKVRKLSGDEIIKTNYNPQTGQPMGMSFVGEQGFTGAIKYVTSDKTPVVYFTQGHGEGTVEREYSNLKNQLETNNYEVKSINLMTSEKVPEDAEILMIASPKADMSPQERDRIKEYLKNGGKAVFLFDSLENDVKFSEFEALLAEYNVGINYDKVKENDDRRYFPKNPYAVVLDVPKSSVIPIDYQLLLANSRSLNILKNQKEYMTVTTLIKTSQTAVGEQIDKSRGKDIAGPLELGVAVENKGGAKPSRILVLGNAYFISDEARMQYGQYFQYGHNFFTLSLNWLMDKKNEVVISPKSYDMPKMNITSAAQAGMLALIVVILLPLAILGTGMFVWMRRRHL